MTKVQLEMLLAVLALLALPVGRTLVTAISHKDDYSQPTTQRLRYYSLLCAAAASALTIAFPVVVFGLSATVTTVRAFYDVSTLCSIATTLVLLFHALTVAMCPVIASYIYARPATYARMKGQYYVLTSDVRSGVPTPRVYNCHGLPAATLHV
ncbi:MAG TPA: hypothetical protein VFT16_04255 [Candidatus Saccharimonadales bacterium]|nr:hypothetical protein [Candidatus Saccharimonadales bacterium]